MKLFSTLSSPDNLAVSGVIDKLVASIIPIECADLSLERRESGTRKHRAIFKIAFHNNGVYLTRAPMHRPVFIHHGDRLRRFFRFIIIRLTRIPG